MTATPPVPTTVKVPALMVVGFIALLKVTVIIWVIGMQVAPLTGDVAVTVGTRAGACSRPHPATRATNTKAANAIFPILNLRISISCSTNDKAFPIPYPPSIQILEAYKPCSVPNAHRVSVSATRRVSTDCLCNTFRVWFAPACLRQFLSVTQESCSVVEDPIPRKE